MSAKRAKPKPRASKQANSPVAATPYGATAEYWKSEVQRLGRNLLFIDTGAIIGCLEPGQERFEEFLSNEIVGLRLITSTHVVAETVRRIVKAPAPNRFTGPNGERGVALALHFLKQWLNTHEVLVLAVPDPVFESAKSSFEANRHIECDLTDALSFVIVKGLESDRIVASDHHFRRLGLLVLP